MRQAKVLPYHAKKRCSDGIAKKRGGVKQMQLCIQDTPNAFYPSKISRRDPIQHDLCALNVGSKRNILYVAKTKQGGNVRLVRLCRKRIPKEDDHIQLSLRDHGADLLIPAERTAFHALDF